VRKIVARYRRAVTRPATTGGRRCGGLPKKRRPGTSADPARLGGVVQASRVEGACPAGVDDEGVAGYVSPS